MQAWMLVALVTVSACAESVLIRSQPPGARVTVDGQDQGTAPVEYVIPRPQFRRGIPVRLTLDGYQATASTLRVTACPGRIVGGAFTLGVLNIFKRPTCFASPQTFTLEPVAARAEAPQD